MEELHVADDQSHYEISLTAGQAFVAFVLLLLSLAAAFAFGLMIGKGQADDRLVVQKETPVVTEGVSGPKKVEGRIVELGVDRQEADRAEPAETPSSEGEPTATAPAAVVEEAPVPPTDTAAVAAVPAAAADAAPVTAPHDAPKVVTYAQLLSTGDQKTAEALAAKLIDRGFTAAYVERGTTGKGPVFRVRVRFESELDARAAESKLKEFSKDVWITTR